MMRYLLFVLLCTAVTHTGWGNEKSQKHSDNPERSFLVLDRFPTSPDWYRPAAAALVREGVIQRYGIEEWASVVLTHELHQHVGIYTILGAKMGVRARELLGAPLRAVRVTLDTGGNGAMTCAADGIQASLASTFGQQLVEIRSPEQPILAAIFELEDRKLKLTLKPEFREIVGGYIRDAELKNGALTPAYFEAVEAISYTVWKDFDRAEIFSSEWLSGSGRDNTR